MAGTYDYAMICDVKSYYSLLIYVGICFLWVCYAAGVGIPGSCTGNACMPEDTDAKSDKSNVSLSKIISDSALLDINFFSCSKIVLE